MPRLLLSTVGSPWIVKLGLVWVFKMPFSLVVVGVLGVSARLKSSGEYNARSDAFQRYLVWLSSCKGTRGACACESSSPGTEETANLYTRSTIDEAPMRVKNNEKSSTWRAAFLYSD